MSHELVASLVQRLGWTLFHSLWQFALVAILLMVVLRFLRDRSPENRYIAGCVALVAMVLLAAFTFGLVEPVDRSSPTTMAGPMTLLETGEAESWEEPSAQSREVPEALRPLDAEAMTERTGLSTGLERSPDDGSESAATSPPIDESLLDRVAGVFIESKRVVMRLMAAWLDTLIAGWLLGVVLLSTRPLIGWHTARRLRACGVQDVAMELTEAAARIARRLGVSRAVAMRQTSLVDVPTVIGALRPLILLPASALTGLPRDQLEAVIAHELGHVRRHDYAVNTAQVLLETLFFYHPAVWWVSHRIRIEREDCCDDMALAITGDRAGYAKMLVWLDERRRDAVATNPAMSAAGGSLQSRVRRILRPRAQHRLRDSGGALTLGSVAVVLLVSCLWLSAMAEKESVGDEPAGQRAPSRFLLPHGVNEILGRIQPDMEEQRLTRLLRRFYPDSKEESMQWSGKSGVVEYQLSQRYTLTVGQHTKPPDHDTRRLHPDASLSVTDEKQKRRNTVTFNDWSQSEAWKDVTLVPDDGGAAQKLLPAAINRILGQIRPEMPEQTVEEIVQRDFPDAKATQGSWSGQTGYVNFPLSPRFEISVAEYNDPNDFERRFVHRDLMMNVVDRMRKLTVRFQVTWDDRGIQVPEGLSAKGRELYRQTNPVQVAKDFLQQQRFDPSHYDMQAGSAVSYCPPQPTQYDWFVSFPNRKAGGDPLLVAVTNERRAWRLDPQTFDRIDETPTETAGQDLARTRPYTGRVVDETGTPIADATLTIDEAVPFRTSPSPSDDRSSLESQKTAIVPADSQCVTTDHAGRFTFERLPADCRLSLFVTAESHTKRRIRIITGRPDDYRGLLSVLPPGQDIMLRRTVVVPIQVVFADTGRPAAKVRVLINHSSGVGSDQKVTDRDGKCVLQVPPGESRLRLAPSGASSDSATRYRGLIISADSHRGSDPLVFKLNRAAKNEDAHKDAPPKEPRGPGDGQAKHDATARPATGTLTGRIVFDGPRPQPQFQDIFAPRTQRDAAAGVEYKRIRRVPDESLVIGRGNGLANAFVYLVANDDSPTWSGRQNPGLVIVRMKGDRIEPRAVGLAPNQPLIIQNVGEESNNAHFAGWDNNWNVLLAPNSSREFPLKVERLPIVVQNDIRPWMKTYLLPHENDLFAVTASDGRFQIENIPPGEWEIRFWHERAGYLKSSIAKNGRVTRYIPPRGVDLNVIKVAPSLFEQRVRTSADGIDTGQTPASTGQSGNDDNRTSNDDSIQKHGNWSTSSPQDVRIAATVDNRGGGERPGFERENGAWHATHIVLADGGERIDGNFRVIESWKGDLPVGQRLSIPELAKYGESATRKIGLSYARGQDDTRQIVTGRTMVLFLVKSDDENGDEWLSAMRHAEHRYAIDFSIVWIEDQDAYAIDQPRNPGPNVLVRLDGGLAKLKSDVERFVTLQTRLKAAREIEDPTQRAAALREFAVSDSWYARRDGFAALADCGTAALPVLRGILNDDRVLKYHGAAITSMGAAAGQDAVSDFIEIIKTETSFWKRTAPSLPVGWWNSNAIEGTDVVELRTRYGRLLAALRALRRHPHRDAAEPVERLRDFWRSLPQLDDPSGLNEISETCNRVLDTIASLPAS